MNTTVKLSELNAEDQKSLRTFLTTYVTQLTNHCAAAGQAMGESLLGLFNSVKDECNQMLSKLPPSDQVPAAMETSWYLKSLLACLSSTQAVIVGLTTRVNELGKSAYNSETLDAKANEMIEARVKAGELVRKETHTALCSEAKTAGLEEGLKQAREEAAEKETKAKLVTDRKALLSKNSLPLPTDEAVLLGDDAAFGALQTKTTARVERLKKIGVAQNSAAWSRVYAMKDDAEFEEFAKMLEGVRGTKPGSSEPFVKPPEGAPPGEKRRILMA